MYRTIAAALVAAAVLGVASCGGTEATITRAQLVEKIDAACTAARETTQKATRSTGTEVAGYLAGLIAGRRALLKQIDGLNPAAAADKQDLEGFKKGEQERLAMFESYRGKAGAELQTAVAANRSRQQANFTRLDAISHRLHLSGCV